MKIEVHSSIPTTPGFREQWNALVHKTESPQVFYTFEWARAVATGYPQVQPLIVSGYRDGVLVGVVALASENNGKSASFLNATTADYCDLVSAPGDRAEFVEAVTAQLRRMQVSDLQLASVPADSFTVAHLRHSAKKAGFFEFTRPAYVCAQVRLDSDEARRQVRRSSNTKLRRMINSAAGKGELVVKHSGSSEDVAQQFPNFASAHVARFLAAGRVSNLVNRERREFLAALAELLSEEGWLSFSTLRLQGQTIAWNFGFNFGGSWFWYQPAFDVAQGHLSPGTFLLCHILKRASDDHEIHTVDLGLGDEEYKQRYARSGRRTLHLTITDSAAKKFFAVSRHYVRELAQKSPHIEGGIRTSMHIAARLRGRVRTQGVLSLLRTYRRGLLQPHSEVQFFELAAPSSASAGLSLEQISLSTLATAAMTYEGDAATQSYLLRCAKRLQESEASGVVLLNESRTAVHFCWIRPFEGFYLSELRQVLREPAPNSMLLFDSWTPGPQRGKGYYAACIAAVGDQLLVAGKRPWIFSATSNVSSLKGIAKSGFFPRFSLTRRGRLFRRALTRVEATDRSAPKFDFHPAA